MKTQGNLRVAIVGAGGYAGAELCAILAGHGRARVVGLFASARREKGDQPGRFEELFPRFREGLGVRGGVGALDVTPASVEAIMAAEPDAVFLATPHEASVELAPPLVERGCKVFDLSAAFRLSEASAYPAYYGFTHARPDLLKCAVYGLCEVNRGRIAVADLVAVPGCYPTSVIVPLKALVDAGAVRRGSVVVVNSISGVSGAGRGLALKSLFCEVSVQPYGVFTHRHRPEMEEHAGWGADPVKGEGGIVFTPHLGAYDRGIVSTMHVELAEGFDAARVRGVMERRYAEERFVRLLPSGSWPSVHDVKHTNYVDIGVAVEKRGGAGAVGSGRAIVVGAIDNLTKGAAGQAVQCMNIRFGIPEWMGLAPEMERWSGGGGGDGGRV